MDPILAIKLGVVGAIDVAIIVVMAMGKISNDVAIQDISMVTGALVLALGISQAGAKMGAAMRKKDGP